jgi:putative chitinase
MIDRGIYFNHVRAAPFPSTMTQQQVDGQTMILDRWEYDESTVDLRWLAYALATTMHETASTMWPIEEYGKGKGMKYGTKDPETGQTYYGRGFVQLTWRENYAKATKKLSLTGKEDIEWHAEMALDTKIASDVMFRGMVEGWFRTKDNKPETLERYFNEDVNDPMNARGIINGDKNTVPKWSGGVSIGALITGYHNDFLTALQASTGETMV